MSDTTAADMDLSHIKAGDCIAAQGRGLAKLTVDRVTPTQIVCGARRYNRKTGRLVGERDVWHSEWAEEWSAEHDAALAEQDARAALARKRAWLSGIRWYRVDDDKIGAVVAALKELGIAP